METVNPRPLLLLVEDYADTREMYAEFFSPSYDVLEAGNAREALELLAKRVPALVITDFTLPGIDGFELIRQMRVNESTRQIPVICLSGQAGRAHEKRAREVGCDRLLEKPCLPEALARTVLELVQAKPGH